MPSRALTTFYPGDQTTVFMLDHAHCYLTAFDRPTAANVAQVIVADSRRNPLSFLTFNCRACDFAAAAGRPRTNIAVLPDFGPPPAYEVDTALPDYHEQDQERTPTDCPRSRRRSLEQAHVAWRSPVAQEGRAASDSPVRPRFRGREALERAIRRQEASAEIIGRDFQPLRPETPPAVPMIAREERSEKIHRDFKPIKPEVQPAVPVIARDFQQNDPTMQSECEALAGHSPPSSSTCMLRAQEEQAGITSRDFQPLTLEAPSAAPVIARDFQPSDPTVQLRDE